MAARKILDENEITQGMIKHHLSYSPDTGEFTWRVPRAKWQNPGDPAGFEKTVKSCPHVVIGLFGRDHYAHRLAWVYMQGSWPTHDLDHEDRNGLNNRWSNIRPATPEQNMQNRLLPNKHGMPGVTEVNTGGFMARVTINRKRTYLGWFATAELANKAVVDARNKAHGSFSITRGT